MSGLNWGRRYLMCPPEHFGVLYEINPWMNKEVAVDAEAALAQWQGLAATLAAAGAVIEGQEPRPDLPDLVFTANAGLVNGTQFIPSRFRHPERQGETPHDVAWFASRGWDIAELPAGVHHEGAGDTLPFAGVLVSGYRFRSDAASHAYLSRLTGAAVRSVELVDPRLYHLDLTFCPLDSRRAIMAPTGWDRYGCRVMATLVPEPLVLDGTEALTFCANSVVVGDNIVMPSCPPRVGRQLEGWGYSVSVAPVEEFLKAGGGCRCLTLALDVVL
ncbi:MAG: dimethylarginine dimethylaminohydrolase family protein [Acidimicrobiales bacterium]